MKCVKNLPNLNIKVLDLDCAIADQIEPDVEEDNYKFCLEQKPRLLRKFIVYRICNFILKILEQPNPTSCKLLFYMPDNLSVKFLKEHTLFIKRVFVKVTKILSLSYYTSPTTAYDFWQLLQNKAGEGKEARARISFVFNRKLKKPDLDKFNKFLLANGISKIDGDLTNNYKVKLGLFIT